MIGIDLGSRNIKIVEMQGDRLQKNLRFDTIAFYRQYGGHNRGQIKLDLAGLGLDVSSPLVATGYGKIKIQVEGALHLPEIQAHVKGAVYQTGYKDFTLLDIGGQDTKVIQVREGRAVDFMTNDRCAASSGRYLENMAAILDMSLEELSSYREDPVRLNSTCAIFGETEIIGRLVDGCPLSSLAAGINFTLYRRCASMLAKLDSELIIMAGGVARNGALRSIIEKETGRPVQSLELPEYNGAIGCCRYGLETSQGGSDAADKC